MVVNSPSGHDVARLPDVAVGKAPIVAETFYQGTTPTNPSGAVYCKYRHPTLGVVTSTFGTDSNMTNPAPGVFHLQLTVDLTGVGDWLGHWQGLGVGYTSSWWVFTVHPPEDAALV